MPSTFTGLLIFLICLVPGFIYIYLAERGDRPGRQVSVFRETAQFVLASVFADIAGFAIFLLARLAFPSITPNLGGLVSAPAEYWPVHYRRIVAWGAGVFGVACLLAYLWGPMT